MFTFNIFNRSYIKKSFWKKLGDLGLHGVTIPG